MKSMSSHGLGLRGRLFAAFGAVATITVLASATAFVSYDRLGRSLEVVTGTSLPHVTRASNIAVAAAEVVGQAQALLAASGADDRTRALKALDDARAALNEAVAAQLRALGAEVVRAARQFQADGTCDYAEENQFARGGGGQSANAGAAPPG